MPNRFLLCLLGLLILTALLFYKGCTSTQKEFPSLDFPDEIQIKYSKTGSDAYSYLEEFRLAISEDHHTYRIIAKVKVVPKNEGAITKSFSYQTAISSKVIKNILESIHKDSWNLSKKPVEIIQQNDYYPNHTLIFTSNKKERFRLYSTSNTITGSPWNLKTKKNLYVTYDSYTGRAVNKLLEALHRDNAKS